MILVPGPESSAAPARPAAGQKLPLSQLAQTLHGKSMRAPLDRLLKRIRKGGTELESLDGPHSGTPLPADPFHHAVALGILNRFETNVHGGHAAAAISDLMGVAAQDGHIDVEQWGRTLGPRGTRFARALVRASQKEAASLAETGHVQGLLQSGAFQPVMYTKDRPSAPRMRSFEAMVARSRGGRPLAGMKLLGVQHLLGSTGTLVRGLVDSGVENVTLFAKPYSDHPAVRDDLKRDGYEVIRTEPTQLGTAQIRDPLQQRMVERVLHDLSHSAPGQRFLLLDDGGKLVRLIHERILPSRPELADRFVAVEQTRKGILELEGMEIKFPVINVAQSWAKGTYEAPLIARSVGKSTEDKLQKLRAAGVPLGRRVLLLGYGTVGRATATHLRDAGYTVEVYDPSPAARARAAADGAQVYETKEAALQHGEIVISATGTQTIDAAATHHLPNGAVLINAASPNEIDPNLSYANVKTATISGRGEVRGNFRGARISLGETLDPTRQDRVLDIRGKQLLLVHDGHVINFTGEADPIPPRYIQLTRGLLYLGALQAARTATPGLHELERAPQEQLVQSIEHELAETGESLSKPTF